VYGAQANISKRRTTLHAAIRICWEKIRSLRVLDFLKGAVVFSVLLRCGASSLGDGHLTFRDRGVVLSLGVEFFTDTSTLLKLRQLGCVETANTNHPSGTAAGKRRTETSK
jgi:hypothetical protein